MCGYALNLLSNFSHVISLKMLEIKKVYFGCWNDRFGGNGSILNTHEMKPHNYQSIGRLKSWEYDKLLRWNPRRRSS